MRIVSKSVSTQKTRRLRAFLLLVALGSPGLYAASHLAAPSLGVVFDEASGELKPVLGIAGAASIGKAFELDEKLKAAAVCSARGFALAIGRDSGEPLVITFGAGSLEMSRLANVPAHPDRLLLSPSCTSSAFLYNLTSQAHIVTGLPGHPSDSSMDISNLTNPGLAAIDDNGAGLLVTTAVKQATSVTRVTANGQLVVFTGTAVSALTFLRDSPDALIADSAIKELLLLQGAASGTPTPRRIVDRQDGIMDATSLAVSGDNRYALVSNPSQHSVTLVDLQTQSGRQVACAGQVDTISSLRNPFLFRLTERLDRPITLIDIRGALPHLSFIAAVPAPTEGGK